MELHFSPKTIGRGDGRQIVAAAAYRAGEKCADERSGILHDYTRKGGIAFSAILTPDVAPIWAGDRSRLWNEVERAEDKSTRRDTARTGREFEISLPYQLSAEQRRALGIEYAQWLVDRYGFAADVSFHNPHKEQDTRNFHVHILTTTRVLTAEGFGRKVSALDNPRTSGAEILAMREKFAELGNAYLDRAGFAERIEHLSYEARGIEQTPTVHVGPSASAMERRGEATERGDENRMIRADNDNRASLKSEHAALCAAIIDLEAEREKRADDKAIRAATRTHDPARVLASMTEKRSTFTREELNRHLSPFMPDVKARSAFMNEILARPEIVPLRENVDAPISRYTTRAVLADERHVLDAADLMARHKTHGLTERTLAETLDHHSHLDREQRAAFAHATAPGRFAMVSGEAGTGKSTTMRAIRDAYEAAGYRVIGMAWKNDVINRMKDEGFKEVSTVQSGLNALKNGRESWNGKTVILIDEAAMLATKPLRELIAYGGKSGAKIIPVYDTKQLGSIERGGMFGALEQRHEPARLTTIYRVKGDDQKAAFNAMWRGDFKTALGIFDKRGAITWSRTPEDARAALVAKWAKDTATDPTKTRMVFAYTNAEVHDLNRDLREIRKERGELGAEHLLKTRDGEKPFSIGDRVAFTASAWKKADREGGLYNGATGTLEAVDGQRVTVKLDTPKDAPERRLSFTLGENARGGEFNAIRLGYSGTIHKSQGVNIEFPYLLHSDHWRAASSYVALSRHREEVALFAAEKPGAWIMAEGGFEKLTAEQRASAERSFAAWAEAKPTLAARYGLGDYVGYVQAQWAEDKDAHRLDRMAKQMGRTDETRAASQFVQGETPPTDEPQKPPVYGRYAELRELAERVKAREAATTPDEATDDAPATPQTYEEYRAAKAAARRNQSEADKSGPTAPADKEPHERGQERESFIRQRPPDRGRSR